MNFGWNPIINFEFSKNQVCHLHKSSFRSVYAFSYNLRVSNYYFGWIKFIPPTPPKISRMKSQNLHICWFFSEFARLFQSQLEGVSAKYFYPPGFDFNYTICKRFLRKTDRHLLMGVANLKFRRPIGSQRLGPPRP